MYIPIPVYKLNFCSIINNYLRNIALYPKLRNSPIVVLL